MNNKMKISCIIIGYNTYNELKLLLESINNQDYNQNNIEIIYIDDGSDDNSYTFFTNYDLQYFKRSIKLEKNLGRAAARSAGIDAAKGEWVFFFNSTVVLKKNIFSTYCSVMSDQSAIGFVGSIFYESKDKAFTNYLNSPDRGTNRFNHLDVLPFQYILLSNCIIKRKIVKTIEFNKQFVAYGGEELDFAYKLYLKYPNSIKLCKHALVYRYNHPHYKMHCQRLYDYGLFDFRLLNDKLKKQVIKTPFFLIAIPGFGLLFSLVYKTTSLIYNKGNKKLNYFLIKLGMWCSILAGYHKSK